MVTKIAFVFPGQGAQSVGMGQDLFEQFEEARSLFLRADEALDYPLSNLIFNGPDEQLKQTYHTQPALLITSIALLRIMQSKLSIRPDYVAGHSLGEYSALVAAGAIDFIDAVKTVRARGAFMEQAVPSGLGAMAAVLGGERQSLAELCAQVSTGGHLVQLANLNCPGQIVISGTAEGVQAISDRVKEIGAKRVIKLEVSGPFHSALMAPAANQLASALDEITIGDARVPLVANVTAEPVTNAADIKRLLVEQVCSSVLWEDTIRRLIQEGVDTFIEIGPGNVLAGLIKKTDATVRTFSVNSLPAIESLENEVSV